MEARRLESCVGTPTHRGEPRGEIDDLDIGCGSSQQRPEGDRAILFPIAGTTPRL
jgi:hypothetical protein